MADPKVGADVADAIARCRIHGRAFLPFDLAISSGYVSPREAAGAFGFRRLLTFSGSHSSRGSLETFANARAPEQLVARLGLVDIIVRTAVPEDAPAIRRLVLEVADEVVAREPTVRRIPSGMIVERRYEDRVRDRERCVLVATGDGRVAGFVDAALVRTADSSLPDDLELDAYVEELIVTSTARRRQIGSMLMRAVEAWAVDVGARMMTLDTHVTNEAARGLYRSLGYREMGVILAKDLWVHL